MRACPARTGLPAGAVATGATGTAGAPNRTATPSRPPAEWTPNSYPPDSRVNAAVPQPGRSPTMPMVEEPVHIGDQGAEALGRRKRELRERMRALRRSIPAGRRAEMEDRAASRLLSLPELAFARTVMVFDSFGSEISTGPAIDLLRRGRHEVLLPYLREGRMGAAGFGGGAPPVCPAPRRRG